MVNKGGAPKGNNNGGKAKIWSDAIRRALARREKGHPKRLNRLADALLNKCEEGDIPALKEFGDRVEGKVPQAITGADGGAIEIAQIRRVIVDKKKPE